MNILNQIRAYLNGGSPTFKELNNLLGKLSQGFTSDTINAEDYLEGADLLTRAIIEVLTSELKEG